MFFKTGVFPSQFPLLLLIIFFQMVCYSLYQRQHLAPVNEYKTVDFYPKNICFQKKYRFNRPALEPNAARAYVTILTRGNSPNVLPLQPIAAHSYIAILIGGNPTKIFSLQPTSDIILLPHKIYTTLTTKWEEFGEDLRPGSKKRTFFSTELNRF